MQLNLNAHYFQAVSNLAATPSHGMGKGYLRGVYCVAHAHGGAVLVATDGHRLGAFYDRNGVADPAGHIICVPRQMLSHMKKSAAGQSERVPFIVDLGARMSNVPTDADGQEPVHSACNGLTMDSGIINRKYCDWRRLVNMALNCRATAIEKKQTCDAVAFNSRYMTDFAACRRADAPPPGQYSAAALSVLPAGAGDPALVLTCCTDFIGVLMPMRGARQDPGAEWVATYDTPPAGLSIAAE